MTPRFCLRRSGSGSAYRLFRFRSSFDEVYFRYDPTVLSASRLWFGLTASSRTLHFGREPSNSTGGTFTHEATNFTGAHPKSEIRRVKMMQCFEAAMICNRRGCIKSIIHSRFQTMDGQMVASDGPFLFRISGLTSGEARPNLTQCESAFSWAFGHLRFSMTRIFSMNDLTSQSAEAATNRPKPAMSTRLFKLECWKRNQVNVSL